MDFECKQCGNDKYIQINKFVKQCKLCGRKTLSSGIGDKNLDWTNEIKDEELKDIKEINYNELLKTFVFTSPWWSRYVQF